MDPRAVPVSLESLEPRLFLSADWPAPLVIHSPADPPAAPAGMDVFEPELDPAAQPPAGAPAFAEWTRDAGPDDTVVFTGWQLSSFTGDRHGKDLRFSVFAQTDAGNALRTGADLLHLEGDSAAIALDDSLPEHGVYFVWAENDSGAGRPMVINAAETWWVGSDEPEPGETVSIYGRNLSHDHGETQSWVWLVGPDGSGRWLDPVAVNPYKVDVVVPAGLEPGDYEVWVHSGHGGDYGWSNPQTLTVEEAFEYDGVTIDVTDFGATGDDASDDQAAIQAAIDACSPGDTLYFPAGEYYFSQRVIPRSGVRWVGDGPDATALKLHADFQQQYAIVFSWNGVDDIAFRDMAFDGNGFSGRDDKYRSLLYFRYSDDIAIENCRLDTGYNADSLLSPNNSRHLVVRNCQLIGGTVNTYHATQVRIDGCDFYMAGDIAAGVISRSVEIDVSDCTAQDLDTSRDDGWGDGRLFLSLATDRSVGNHYLGHNVCNELTPRPNLPDQNQGEVILWEQGGVIYHGSPVAAGDNWVTFGDLGDAEPSSALHLVIAEGKGMGQARAIAGFDPASGTVTLDEPWNVIPDGGSRILLSRTLDKAAVYGNYIDAKDRGHESESHIANTGVQPYSGAHNFVCDNNVLNDLRSGIHLCTRNSGNLVDPPDPQPQYFSLFRDNTYTDLRRGGSMHGYGPEWGVSMLGNIVRDSAFVDTILPAFGFRAKPAARLDPWMLLNVIEHNTAVNTPGGVDFDSAVIEAVGGLIVRENAFDRGTAEYVGSKAIDYDNTCAGTVLVDNAWTGFETLYYGYAPGAQTGAFDRVTGVSTYGEPLEAEIAIRNTGTLPLYWTALSSEPWLSIVTPSGTVEDECDQCPLTVAIDPSGMAAGVHRGDVRVTAGGRTTTLTVELTLYGFMPGDFNGDGAMNGLDIPEFKAALADADAWAAAHPGRPHPDLLGDFDGNGALNGLDVPGFKSALAAGVAACAAPLGDGAGSALTELETAIATEPNPAFASAGSAVRAVSADGATREEAVREWMAFAAWRALRPEGTVHALRRTNDARLRLGQSPGWNQGTVHALRRANCARLAWDSPRLAVPAVGRFFGRLVEIDRL